MDFDGIVLFEIASKGSLVDLRFDFLVSQGKNLALYSFDNDSSAADQAFADAAVRARMQRKKPKMKIHIIGERPANPATQRMTQDFNKLASMKGDKAVAKISKFSPPAKGTGGSGSFSVTLTSQVSKTDKITVDVPFDGDPDALAGETFHGKLSLFAHSKEKDADIPELINLILDIKP
jgi:hypothetical protein